MEVSQKWGKDKKIVFRISGVTDYKALETKYKEMALKGWLIEKSIVIGDSYVAVEPIDLDFSVTLFQRNTLLEYPDEDKGALYKELCEDSGWTFVKCDQRYQVYHKPTGSEARPIHTDPVEEYNSIKRAFYKSEIFMPILILLQLFILLSSIITIRYDNFLSPSGLLSIVSPLILIVLISMYFIPVLIWFIKNGIRVKRGDDLEFESSKSIEFRNRLYMILSIFYLIYLSSSMASLFLSNISSTILLIFPIIIILPLAVVLGLRYIVKKKKRSKKVNLLIVSVVFLITWLFMMVMIFGVLGLSVGDDEDTAEIPDVAIINYADFQSKLEFQPKRVKVQSSFLSPLNFTYVTSHRGGHEDQIDYIDVEYMETRFDWVTRKIVDLILDVEKKYVEEEREYGIEGDKFKNYIYQIKGFEDQVDYIYNLSSSKNSVMLIKNKSIYIISFDVPIEGEILNIIVNKLFAK